MADYATECCDVGVSELSHDGSLLEKLDSVGRVCQSLHSHVVLSVAVPPHTLAHTSKLTRAQVGHRPMYILKSIKSHLRLSKYIQCLGVHIMADCSRALWVHSH